MEFFNQAIDILKILVMALGAVSYTHLDVYKRQEGERLMCAGGSWTPSIGQAPEGWHEGSGFSSWRILEADVPQTYLSLIHI